MNGSNSPTVILVHGGFADASCFARLTPPLLADGVSVVAPAVPNRSLSGDAAYIAAVIRQVDGPVVLVGHSYGGAVITVAGTEEKVKALVYLSGYALDQGESIAELQARFPDWVLARGLLYRMVYPVEGAAELGTDVSVDPARFPDIVAADLDPGLARVLAVSQRPLAVPALLEKASAAAWRRKPSWAVVSAADHTINPDVQRFGYARAGITPVEIDASHMVTLSRPEEVYAVVRQAINSVRASEYLPAERARPHRDPARFSVITPSPAGPVQGRRQATTASDGGDEQALG